MSSRLADKWVIITGASSGFGAAAARAFAAERARVILGARRVDRLKEVTMEAEKAGAREAHFQRLDVAKTESVEEFAKWVRTLTDRADVLVNNAGGAKGLDHVAEGKDEDWEFMIQTNVLGLLRVSRALLPLMISNPGASVINIGSTAGRNVYEGGAAYCAAKAGVLEIGRALRLEL